MELTFILTEQCNLRCRYCYQPSYPVNDMPVEVALAAVSRALQESPRNLSLTFFGGEPLVRADALFQILARARTLAGQVPLTAKVPTNGLLLTDDVIEQAAMLGLFISLSFDGVRQAQDAGRVGLRGESSFEQAESALRRLVRRGLPFGVYSVVTPANVAFLAESRRYLWDMGARLLMCALDYGAEWSQSALDTLIRQYALVGKFYSELLRRKEYFHLQPFDSRVAMRTRSHEMAPCTPGVRQITVGPDGSLYGCVEYFYRRQLQLGTVASWLEPERVKELLKARGGQAPECAACGVRDRCLNHCDCANLRASGRADRPSLTLCLSEQETIRQVDRTAAELFRERVPEFLLRQYGESYHLLYSIERLVEDQVNA
jgi:uncharacterized protein